MRVCLKRYLYFVIIRTLRHTRTQINITTIFAFMYNQTFIKGVSPARNRFTAPRRRLSRSIFAVYTYIIFILPIHYIHTPGVIYIRRLRSNFNHFNVKCDASSRDGLYMPRSFSSAAPVAVRRIYK